MVTTHVSLLHLGYNASENIKNLPGEGVSWSSLMYPYFTWAMTLLKTLKTYLERVYHGTHSCIIASLGL